jgi:hypothetical protein
MQPTISIPKHWEYPRFALEQRTQDGIILGFYRTEFRSQEPEFRMNFVRLADE